MYFRGAEARARQRRRKREKSAKRKLPARGVSLKNDACTCTHLGLRARVIFAPVRQNIRKKLLLFGNLVISTTTAHMRPRLSLIMLSRSSWLVSNGNNITSRVSLSMKVCQILTGSTTLACRRGVIVCVFQGGRGKSEAEATQTRGQREAGVAYNVNRYSFYRIFAERRESHVSCNENRSLCNSRCISHCSGSDPLGSDCVIACENSRPSSLPAPVAFRRLTV